MSGSSEHPHRSWTCTLRPLPDGGAATTTTLVDLDNRSLPTTEHRQADGLEISDHYDWDADRRLLLSADQYGRAVRYERNWAGWLTRIDDVRDPAWPAVTTLDYDPRGFVTERSTPPAGTTFRWNPFGQLVEKTAPGQPAPIEHWPTTTSADSRTIASAVTTSSSSATTAATSSGRTTPWAAAGGSRRPGSSTNSAA